MSADGSPVAIYAALPAEPDLSVVRRWSQGRTAILDLGCGTGRIAEPLAREGHDVVAVDEFEPMLAHITSARPVAIRIEDLDLKQRFDLVLLLSQLINSETALDLVASAAHHLREDGILLLQRLVPGRSWQTSEVAAGEVTIGLDNIKIEGVTVSATSTYRLGDQVWCQQWQLREREDDDLADLLGTAGLRVVEAAGQWVVAARALS